MQRSSVEVSIPFACDGCGFSATVIARGSALASGAMPGEGLSQRAYDSAWKNAAMRCELTPCPRCQKRRYASFVRSLRNAMLYMLAFVAACVAVYWLSDRRGFERNAGELIAIYGGMLFLVEAFVVGIHLLELRRAPRAVRFVE